MNFNPEEFGLKKDYLYEIISTTYSLTEKAIKPNASCMGIRMIEENQIQISPFFGTTTYQNLKEHSIIAINFVDDVYMYALAALKEPNSPIGLNELPKEYFEFKHMESRSMDVPYIKNVWGILIGEVSREFQKEKHDDLGEMMVPVFTLDIILAQKYRDSFKIFNRAENLALETIILATKLKAAKGTKDNKSFNVIHEKIIEHMSNIERFGKNKDALKTLELVSNYISKLLD